MKRDIKFKVNFTNIIFFLLFMFILFSLTSTEVVNKEADSYVIFTFLINFIMSSVMVIKDKKPYSLNKTYWYFNLIFFVLAPIIQYLSLYDVWKYKLDDLDYIIGNLIVLFSNVLYFIIYEHIMNKSKKLNNNELINQESVKINTNTTIKIIMFILLIFSFLYTLKNIGFSGLFSRSGNSYTISENNTFNTIIGHFFRCLPVYVFYVFYSKQNKMNLMALLSLVITCILNFPTSTTRFWMGAIYIGIFLMIFNKENKHRRRYDIILLFVFSLIFPLLFIFKFNDISYFMKNGIQTKSIVESYNSVDYDAYSIIPRSISYVQDNGVVYGKQLLGTVLFLVPRQIWHSKPEPTGSIIANAQNQYYTNISCPYISEGYINFGIMGLIIFQIILVVIISKLDLNYWYNKSCNKNIKILYPFLMGFLIYLLRGALHPAVVYLFCFCLPLFILNFLSMFGGVKNDKNN